MKIPKPFTLTPEQFKALTFQEQVITMFWHVQAYFHDQYGEYSFRIESENGDCWMSIGDWLEVRVHPGTILENGQYYPVLHGKKIGVFEFDGLRSIAESYYFRDSDSIFCVNDDMFWGVDIKTLMKNLRTKLKKKLTFKAKGEAKKDELKVLQDNGCFS